ncbi:hypothetical protein PGT21_009107 [Puccinia graminis f. sp. tritici]|uniref:Uncharacterized protein n=1 Tax=Puccinia graminis f. sp. tritici TaxID=56615 RepID=A0A5B0PR40_PUCGR|nr:hypothetical protein PGT21_009107 [Puccinia graminis f. sp. tritici]
MIGHNGIGRNSLDRVRLNRHQAEYLLPAYDPMFVRYRTTSHFFERETLADVFCTQVHDLDLFH